MPAASNFYPSQHSTTSYKIFSFPTTAREIPAGYTQAAQTYQMAELKAPADPLITIAKTYSGQSTTTSGAGNLAPVADQLQIPEGYQALSATIIASLAQMPDNTGSC